MIIIPFVIWLLNKTKWLLAPLFLILFIMFMENSWFLAIFLMGAILHKYQDRLFRLFNIRKWTLYVVFLIGFILWQAQVLIYTPDSQILWEMCIMEMIESIGVTMLLSVILKNSDLPILTSSPLLFMGKVSYEFYIIHFMLLMGLLPFISNIWLYIIICFSCTLFFSIILNRSSKWLTDSVMNQISKRF